MRKFNFRLSRTQWILLVLLFLVTFVGSGRWTIGLAAWISPILGLRFMRHHEGAWSAYLLLLLAIWVPNTVAWNGIIPQDNLIIHIVFMLVQTAFALIPYAVDRLVVRNYTQLYGNPFWLTLVFPILATGFEFLNVGTSPLGTFGGTGYSQYDLPFIAQFASVAGIWGIAFLINWLASTINWAWELDFSLAKTRRGLLTVAAILLLTIVYGALRPLFAQENAAQSVKVASFTLSELDPQTLFPQVREDKDAFRETTASIRQLYLDRTVEAAQNGAQLVLWPEAAGVGIGEDVDALLLEAQQIADTHDIYLAVPTFALYPDSDRRAENRLQIIDPDGEIALNHIKYGGNILEGTLPGDKELQIIETPFGRLTGAVCWDADFPNVIQQAGQAGADILLVPARVWPAVSNMHAEMSAFRAIENGLSVIYQADAGVSQITNPWGKELVKVDPYAGDVNEMIYELPVQRTGTIYPLIGEAFGMILGALAGLCLLLGIVLAILNFRKRKKAAAEVAAT